MVNFHTLAKDYKKWIRVTDKVDGRVHMTETPTDEDKTNTWSVQPFQGNEKLGLVTIETAKYKDGEGKPAEFDPGEQKFVEDNKTYSA
ncbi:hypothetical protein L2449_09710 [Mesorhizobium muleiense]|uniref:hypothetical protein n=1 Tax=Mesorhizobium muleiense TaxID=1004279 RepID=UPI001F22D5B5|nr:hypothetical protein [Mesorhizobium muleiense]MCF6117188.1 hypothetical protein [Mesorhizobium muleiense]